MRGVVRGGEGVYRYGGDEFAALVPGARPRRRGARRRRASAPPSRASPSPSATGHRLRITCSVGVASLPEDGEDATALIEAADRAMFRAKAGGKDKVEAAGG